MLLNTKVDMAVKRDAPLLGGRSAGSEETRRLTHHAAERPYTTFDFISSEGKLHAQICSLFFYSILFWSS